MVPKGATNLIEKLKTQRKNLGDILENIDDLFSLLCNINLKFKKKKLVCSPTTFFCSTAVVKLLSYFSSDQCICCAKLVVTGSG